MISPVDSTHGLMKYDPATGQQYPYPSHEAQYRAYHGSVAWLYNPWTGDARSAHDVGSDVFGLGINQLGPFFAAKPDNQRLKPLELWGNASPDNYFVPHGDKKEAEDHCALGWRVVLMREVLGD